ncbi:hypothetical protein [Devosia sp. Root635]|uniref:hypothetical protein n=1 Tax=Devosia sp. Root635 TaxID=1736575 RepID=UPI0006F4ADA2|nr:hypothetical protein [Devosia sp. Root635]KRA42071.1 hypothetical protein ASD80_10110 [Devosia sp. Root635]
MTNKVPSRPARVPNTESDERRRERIEREAILTEQRAFLDSFERQVAELEAKATGHACDAPKDSAGR